MTRIKTYIQNFFKGHERSIKAKKNIIASLFIKGFSIIIGLLLVPITLDYLDQTRYGIWLTVSSFLIWFGFFEIGLGNGLRNKLAEALAVNELSLAKIYVSTTYFLLSIIMILFIVIFFALSPLISWTTVLNAAPEMEPELETLVLIVFSSFFIRFVLKLIGTVLLANQRPALNNSLIPISNLLSLIVIYILTKMTKGSLIYIGITYSFFPVIVFIIASLILYSRNYKDIRPSLSHIKMKYAKPLLSVGVKFFIIQISALIIFQTTNIIIAQFFGPNEVTTYNIAFKYFGIINMLFAIILTPFWSAYTEAWVKNEIKWIKKTIQKISLFWIGTMITLLFMVIFSDFFYTLWIGEKNMKTINIPISLSILLAIYFAVRTFGSIFNMFINGIGKIKLQLISLVIGAVLFFPLTVLFVKGFNWGINGIVLATIISNFYSVSVAPIQYYKIINGKAKGIWNE